MRKTRASDFELFESGLRDKLRMVQWLVIAAVLYGGALTLRATTGDGGLPSAYAPIETMLWKLGNVTVASYVGYFIDRHAFRDNRISEFSDPLDRIRRAIVMASAMLAVALGL